MPYGNNSEVGICFQNSYGTSLTSSMHWIPLLSEDVGLEKPPLVSQNMSGRYDEGNHFEGPNMINGSINCEANPIALGVLLKAIMGNPTTVASGAVRTHTFKPITTEFDGVSANVPFVFYKYLDDQGSAMLYYDLNATSLELSINNGELLMAKLGLTGGKFTQSAKLAAAYPTGKEWTWDQASVSFGGSGISAVRALSVKLNEPIEAKHTMNNSKFPSRNKRTGFRTVEISGTLTFDDQTEFQQFLNQTERSLVLNFLGATQIQSGYYESVKIELPLGRYFDFKPVIGGPGELEVSVSGKGIYSVTSATAMQITLVNTKTGY